MRCPLSALPVKTKIVGPALRPENAPNERQLFARRQFADLIAVRDKALRFDQLCAAIVMNCDETVAFFYAVTDAFVEFEADGVIDTVFLFLAAAAERGKSRAKLFAIRCRDKAHGWAGD